MMGSRSASLLSCLAMVLRAAVALGPTLVVAGGVSTAFSLLTRGFLEIVFLVVVATGGAGADVFVVAARALVVLVGAGGGMVGTAFARDDALVGAVVLEAILG